MTTSLIPFSKGQTVLERIGDGEGASTRLVKVIDHDETKCKTATGNWYVRTTGMRLAKGDPYRSITSPEFCKGASE